MKLHDAIKEAELSKTRIMRESKDEYIDVNKSPYLKQFSKVDILSNDWIVEELALKPCPLCGSSVKREREHDDRSDYGNYIIICSNYKCLLLLGHSGIFTSIHNGRRKIIEAWNTRTGEK